MSWIEMKGGGLGKEIFCDSNGTIWLIGINNSIFTYSFNRWNEYSGGGKAIDISVYNGTPYILGLNNSVWKG